MFSLRKSEQGYFHFHFISKKFQNYFIWFLRQFNNFCEILNSSKTSKMNISFKKWLTDYVNLQSRWMMKIFGRFQNPSNPKSQLFRCHQSWSLEQIWKRIKSVHLDKINLSLPLKRVKKIKDPIKCLINSHYLIIYRTRIE